MTKQECAVVEAYTGIVMLTGDDRDICNKYIQKILGRPVWTHELACKEVQKEIKEKSLNDFLTLCKEAKHNGWINCEEKPPEKNGRYLVRVRSSDGTADIYFETVDNYSAGKWLIDEKSKGFEKKVTQWMEVPKWEL